MTAPSKNFNTIPDSDIDPESPLTTGLMTSIRDALVNVDEQVSYGFVRAQAHNHDGINSSSLPGNIFGTLFAFWNYT
jgi:hypothetical protein